MSEEKKVPDGGVTLDALVERWNSVAPFLDGLAHNMDLDLDAAGDLGRARKVIRDFLTDCDRTQAMRRKHAQRAPEEQRVIEEAETELRARAKAAGIKLKKIVGGDEPDKEVPDKEGPDTTTEEASGDAAAVS